MTNEQVAAYDGTGPALRLNPLALAEEGPDAVTSWEDFTTDLVDALVGLWTAPISR